MTIASSFDPHRLVDATIRDPAYLDPDFPYEQFVTHLISQGTRHNSINAGLSLELLERAMTGKPSNLDIIPGY